MKTSTVLFTTLGLATAVAGTLFAVKGKDVIQEKKRTTHQRQAQAEIATELLERTQAMLSYQVIDDDDFEDLLTDLHFFWNGVRAMGPLEGNLEARVIEFDNANQELLDDLDNWMPAIPQVERHLINAIARLNDFLSHYGEEAK